MAPCDSLVDLLADCAQRDRRAFEALYRQAAPALRGLLLGVIHDRELTDDLLQEGFVRIWRRAGDYRPQLGQPITWMGSIVRHLAIDQMRRGQQHPRAELDESGWALLADDRPGPEERLYTERGAATLTQCLKILEPEPRRAVLLVYYEGLTHDAIAQRMERPLGTIKAWVRRGLQRLKTCMTEPMNAYPPTRSGHWPPDVCRACRAAWPAAGSTVCCPPVPPHDGPRPVGSIETAPLRQTP